MPDGERRAELVAMLRERIAWSEGHDLGTTHLELFNARDLLKLIDRPAPTPTPDAAALTAEPLLPWLEKWQEHLDEYFFQLSHMVDCQQFAQAVHSRLPEIIATLRSQAAEIERITRAFNQAVADGGRGKVLKEFMEGEQEKLLGRVMKQNEEMADELAACRAATIEECAKITDDLRESGDNDEDQRMMDHTLGWNEAAESIGERIRALATSAPPPEAAT